MLKQKIIYVDDNIKIKRCLLRDILIIPKKIKNKQTITISVYGFGFGQVFIDGIMF